MNQPIAQKNQELFDRGMTLLEQAAQNKDFAGYLLAGALCRQAIDEEALRLEQLRCQQIALESSGDKPMAENYARRFLTNEDGVEMAPVFADLGGKYTVLEQVDCPDCTPGYACGTCYDRGEVLLVEPIEEGDRTL